MKKRFNLFANIVLATILALAIWSCTKVDTDVFVEFPEVDSTAKVWVPMVFTFITHDTVWVNKTDSIFIVTTDTIVRIDSVFTTNTIYEKIYITQYDSVFVTKYDSIFVTRYDSIFINTHDSIFINTVTHDTIHSVIHDTLTINTSTTDTLFIYTNNTLTVYDTIYIDHKGHKFHWWDRNNHGHCGGH